MIAVFFAQLMFRRYWPVILIIALVQGLFLAYQVHTGNFYLDDSKEYLRTADNMLTQGTVYCGDLQDAPDPALYTKRPPGYPAFLILIRIFTSSMLPVIILQSILSLASILLLIKLFGDKKRGAWLLLPLILFFPAQFIYANLVMAEILLQIVIMLAVLLMWLYLGSLERKYLWGYQFLLILSILIKPVMYLFVVPNFLFSIYLFIKRKRRLTLISGLLPLVFVIIYAGINQQRTGLYHVSSIQTTNLVDYNMYYFLMNREGAENAGKVKDQVYEQCAGTKDFKAHESCLKQQALEVIKEDPVAYALFHIKGIIRMFIDPGRFDLYNFFHIEKKDSRGFLFYLNQGGIRGAWHYFLEQPLLIILTLGFIALFNLVRLAGFLAFLFNRNVSPEFRILLVLLIGTIAAATGPLGASRFLLPVVLLITGGAFYQYRQWYNRLTER